MFTIFRELSHGHFHVKNHKPLKLSDRDVPTYEARVDGDTRLVVGLSHTFVICVSADTDSITSTEYM